jgi:hypothetical protein
VAGKDTLSGMQTDERHVYGPRPIGTLVPRLTRPAFRRRSPATAQVLADWTAIMGPALASTTTPVRLSSGTLTIACAGPVAMELQHLANEVMARINTHLGRETVKTLRFVQTRELIAPLSALAPAPDPARLVQADAALQASLGDLPQGELRSALASLGRALAISFNRSRSR